MHWLVYSGVHSAFSGGQKQVGLSAKATEHHRCDRHYTLLCHDGVGPGRDARCWARGCRSDIAGAEDDASVLAHEAGQTLPGPADTGADTHAVLQGNGNANGVCLRRHGDIQRSGPAVGARLGLGNTKPRLCQHPCRRLVGHNFHDDSGVRGRVPCDNRGTGAWGDVCGEWHRSLGTAHHIHLPQFCTVLPRTETALCQMPSEILQ